MTEMHNVLWTGGWDSSYRVLDLVLVQKKQVQPWYIASLLGRVSTPQELRAMDEIRAELEKRDPDAAARILPTITVRDKDISVDPEVAAKLKSLQRQQHLGDQYGPLASFAKQKGIKLELSVVKGGLRGLLCDRFYTTPSGDIEVSAELHEDLYLFSYFRYPLSGLTKMDMRAEAEKHGFRDLLELTWFCHLPLRQKPCGICQPCQYARQGGMSWRVPGPTLTRQVAMMSKHLVMSALVYVRTGGRHWVGPRLVRASR